MWFGGLCRLLQARCEISTLNQALNGSAEA
jgi:hypothetical protein